jgi:hypothetical protein
MHEAVDNLTRKANPAWSVNLAVNYSSGLIKRLPMVVGTFHVPLGRFNPLHSEFLANGTAEYAYFCGRRHTD